MKIVCDACQAKYSISDDKVQGKVFKIRCKKCSNIIVVRGGAGATEAPAPVPQEKDTRVYDYGYEGGDQPPAADDAVWHLVINQDQIGPMTVAEVQHRFAAGEVDGETFTWREGFADWLPLAQVDTFAALVASGSTTSAHGGGHAAVSAMFGSSDDMGGGTSRNDPGDLFAAASGAQRGHDDDDGGGDLFGSKPAASQRDAAANTKLRGERNENSVLFSLNNLAQLASDTPARSAPASSSSGPSMGHATGAAGGEGSGLIDIRSMANAYLGGAGVAVGKPASAGIGSIDDLPVFGGGGFSEPAVIVPSARAQSSNKVLYAMIGAIGLLAVALVVIVVVLLKGGSKTTPQVAAADDKTAKTPDKADSAATAPDKTDPNAGSGTATGSGSASEPPPATGSGSATQVAVADTNPKNTPTEPPPSHNPTPPAHHESRPTHTSSTPAVHEPKPPKPDTTAPKPDKPDPGGCEEVGCVINNYEGACCAKFRKHAAGGGGGGGGDTPKAHSDLPDALDRGMISTGIGNIKARVNSCGEKSPAKGQVKVHVKVGADGRVSGVTVASSPDNALGACVAAAVGKASFAKTQSGGSFSYPFVF